MTHRLPTTLLALVLGSGLLPLAAWGQESGAPVATAPGMASPHPVSDEASVARFSGLFEIDLPVVERRGNVRVNYQPHFRDLLDKDYLRVPVDVRWGFNDRLELDSAVDTYFTHGLRSGDAGNGLSAVHFGAKYACYVWLKRVWNTSVGFNVTLPVSRPPMELSDGHQHYTPYIVFGRKIDDIAGLMGYLHASFDIVEKSGTPGNWGENEPHGNSMSLTPGVVWDRGVWHYTLEVDATTTRLIGGGNHDFLTIRPGVVWELPKALRFHARGRWLAGFNVSAVFGPDGNKISTGGRFRGEINFSRWLGGKKQEQPANADSTAGTK
jgi:hypothetical protein